MLSQQFFASEISLYQPWLSMPILQPSNIPLCWFVSSLLYSPACLQRSVFGPGSSFFIPLAGMTVSDLTFLISRPHSHDTDAAIITLVLLTPVFAHLNLTNEIQTAILHSFQCSRWFGYAPSPSGENPCSPGSRNELWLWLAHRRHFIQWLCSLLQGTRLSASALNMLRIFIPVALHQLCHLSCHLMVV